MDESDDLALLREFVEHNSQEAFATLVSRHVNRVYSIALRQTQNAQHAEEITQAVFVILARKSHGLRKSVILSGWLYETTRLTSITFIRSEIRRSRREREACMQNSLNEKEPDIWARVAPFLDEAMIRLNAKDRHAVILRFFDGKSMKEVGVAMDANEEAAKKRVSRAVDKLRGFFAKRGIIASSAALTAAMASNSVQAAPVILANSITAVAFTSGASATTSTLTLVKGTLNLMAWLKAKTTVIVGALVLTTAGSAPLIWRQFDSAVKHFSETPGGSITVSAMQFLLAERKAGTLPGYTLAKDIKSVIIIPDLHRSTNGDWQMSHTNAEEFPTLRTLDLRTNTDAGFVWHYTVMKETKKADWRMQKAWQTDEEGKLAKEFPVKAP